MRTVDNKREYYLSKVILTSNEAEESLKHTSEVRHIDPKTGEYLTEAPKLSKEILLKHWVMSKRNNYSFIRSIQYQVRKDGWNSLTDKQIQGCVNTYNAHKRKSKKKEL